MAPYCGALRLSVLLLGSSLAFTSALAEESTSRSKEAPLEAGTDVPAPQRTKLVLPEYPEGAQRRGVRGIVMLEVIIEKDGSVSAADVLRSIPLLDEAAVTAALQWRFKPTKVDGRAVRVRLAVPVTFAMKMPYLSRADGIPELRQGAAPAYPADAKGRASVEAEVTLDLQGDVAEVLIVKGASPWQEAVLGALRTWAFKYHDSVAALSFHLTAEFVPAAKKEAAQVRFTLSQPRQRRVHTSQPDAAVKPQTADTPADADDDTTSPPAADVPPAPTAPEPAVSAPVAGPPTPEATEPGETLATEPTALKADPPAPPVEVLRIAPPRQSPAQPPAAAQRPAEPGYSSVRDVSLGPGVPDLAQGRRPTPPPIARMMGITGVAKVRFSVGASGLVLVNNVEAPRQLELAAREMVGSWEFRRRTAERLYLTARVHYTPDGARATIDLDRPEPPLAPSETVKPEGPQTEGDTPEGKGSETEADVGARQDEPSPSP